MGKELEAPTHHRCVGVCEHLDEAVSALRSFDVVGTPTCLHSVLLAMDSKLRLPLDSWSNGWLRMSTDSGRNRPRKLIQKSPYLFGNVNQ